MMGMLEYDVLAGAKVSACMASEDQAGPSPFLFLAPWRHRRASRVGSSACLTYEDFQFQGQHVHVKKDSKPKRLHVNKPRA